MALGAIPALLRGDAFTHFVPCPHFCHLSDSCPHPRVRHLPSRPQSRPAFPSRSDSPPPPPVSAVFPWGLTTSLVSSRSGPFCLSAAPGLHLGPSSDLALPGPPLSLFCSRTFAWWPVLVAGVAGVQETGSQCQPCGIKQITSPSQDSVPCLQNEKGP